MPVSVRRWLGRFKARGAPTVELADALARRLVRVELLGRADGDGTRARLRLVSLSDEPVRIRVRRGTVFSPSRRP